MKKIKYGFVELESKEGSCYTYRVKILNEFNGHYEVKYLDLVRSTTYNTLRDKPKILTKGMLFEIYEKELNWFQKYIF